MAKVTHTPLFVCDRCGAENQLLKGEFHDGSMHIKKALYRRFPGTKEHDLLELDLCHKCAEEFMSWLNEIKTNDR